MKTLILTTTTMAALLLTGANTAEAGKFQLVIGNGGGYVNPGYGGGFGGFNGGYAPINNGHLHHDVNPHVDPNPIGGHYDWHDTTHSDYIPGRWVKHGCHYHYIPGRYVLHQDGHWDLHHHD
jgi:hypothetical protein